MTNPIVSFGVSFTKKIYLVTVIIAILSSMSLNTNAQTQFEESMRDTECPIPPPKTQHLNPTMVASYPGSGAKLTWKLIRAISGYMTSDDAVDHLDLAKQRLVIAIKTHYPARGSNDQVFQPYADVPRSVLLIRNPMNAIPSFHSFLYEQSIGATGHSMRAPVDKWIEWRDRHFEQEIQYWLDHIMFWMEHHPFENRFILPYEYLIRPGAGPTELRKLRSFLEHSIEGIAEMRTPIQKVDCIWDFIVMKREDEGTDVGSMRQGGPTVWPYTHDQINKIKAVLGDLMLKWPGQLRSLMELYLFQVSTAQSLMSMN